MGWKEATFAFICISCSWWFLTASPRAAAEVVKEGKGDFPHASTTTVHHSKGRNYKLYLIIS